MDDGSSRQNGFSKNKHLKEAHQTLDNNLGKNKQITNMCIIKM